jgi:hypothetical protein
MNIFNKAKKNSSSIFKKALGVARFTSKVLDNPVAEYVAGLNPISNSVYKEVKRSGILELAQ